MFDSPKLIVSSFVSIYYFHSFLHNKLDWRILDSFANEFYFLLLNTFDMSIYAALQTGVML